MTVCISLSAPEPPAPTTEDTTVSPGTIQTPVITLETTSAAPPDVTMGFTIESSTPSNDQDFTPTPTPILRDNCQPLNSTTCNDILPYNMTYFPSQFGEHPNTTEMIAASIFQKLSNCDDAAVMTMCYILYPPCEALEFPICQGVCLDSLDNCQTFMNALLSFFSWKQVTEVREMCHGMPTDNCIKPRRPPEPTTPGPCKS